jgi:hypothetical protein
MILWALVVLGIVNAATLFVFGFKLDSIYNTVTHINNRGYDIQTDLNQLREDVEPFINSNGAEEFPDEAYKPQMQSQRGRKGI